MRMFPALAALAAMLHAEQARASGPYIVDDAAITPPGTGQIEAWLSLSRDNSIVNFVPATTLRPLPSVEWSLTLNGSRVFNSAATTVAMQGKWQLRDPDHGQFGLALAGNVALDAGTGRAGTAHLYSALTVPAGERIRLHGNLGWSRSFGDDRRSTLNWGARAEAAVVPDRLAVHAEAFGASRGGAGYQVGLRPTNRKGNVDLELLFGRNLAGERHKWLTMGTAIRF
jgi:hypothetical protein